MAESEVQRFAHLEKIRRQLTTAGLVVKEKKELCKKALSITAPGDKDFFDLIFTAYGNGVMVKDIEDLFVEAIKKYLNGSKLPTEAFNLADRLRGKDRLRQVAVEQGRVLLEKEGRKRKSLGEVLRFLQMLSNFHVEDMMPKYVRKAIVLTDSSSELRSILPFVKNGSSEERLLWVRMFKYTTNLDDLRKFFRDSEVGSNEEKIILDRYLRELKARKPKPPSN